MVLPIPPGEIVRISTRPIREGFALVTITNTDDGPFAIDTVGIWFPTLSMGYAFGPSGLMNVEHPFPSYPVTLAPGEVVTYPFVGNMVRALGEAALAKECLSTCQLNS